MGSYFSKFLLGQEGRRDSYFDDPWERQGSCLAYQVGLSETRNKPLKFV